MMIQSVLFGKNVKKENKALSDKNNLEICEFYITIRAQGDFSDPFTIRGLVPI